MDIDMFDPLPRRGPIAAMRSLQRVLFLQYSRQQHKQPKSSRRDKREKQAAAKWRAKLIRPSWHTLRDNRGLLEALLKHWLVTKIQRAWRWHGWWQDRVLAGLLDSVRGILCPERVRDMPCSVDYAENNAHNVQTVAALVRYLWPCRCDGDDGQDWASVCLYAIHFYHRRLRGGTETGIKQAISLANEFEWIGFEPMCRAVQAFVDTLYEALRVNAFNTTTPARTKRAELRKPETRRTLEDMMAAFVEGKKSWRISTRWMNRYVCFMATYNCVLKGKPISTTLTEEFIEILGQTGGETKEWYENVWLQQLVKRAVDCGEPWHADPKLQPIIEVKLTVAFLEHLSLRPHSYSHLSSLI